MIHTVTNKNASYRKQIARPLVQSILGHIEFPVCRTLYWDITIAHQWACNKCLEWFAYRGWFQDFSCIQAHFK